MIFHRAALWCFLLVAGIPLVDAQIVEIEGSAAIQDGAVVRARNQALEDALRQAALYGGARVHASTTTENNMVTRDQTRVNASGSVQILAVLNEWRSGDQLHIKVRAKVSDSAVLEADNRQYRKKIAVMQFEVMDRTDIQDLSALERLYPQRMLQLLDAQGQFSGIDATNQLFSAQDGRRFTVGDPPSRALVAHLASELGAQFMVQGVIHDLGLTANGFGFRRNVVMEIMVLDGLTGSVIGRHTFSDSLVGGRDLRVTTVFDDPVFQNQALGKTLQGFLQRQVQAIALDLSGLPFSARVIRSEGGSVYIDVGAVNRVQVGDVFNAYRVDHELSIGTASQFMGHPEKPLASFVVKIVQPLFALGELDETTDVLRPGDIVRLAR